MSQEEDFYKVQRLLRKTDAPYTDEDIAELRRVSPHFANAGTDYRDVAQFRSSIELIAAIRKFDKASGELVSTTNNLTVQIKRLTVLGVCFAGCALLLGAASLIVSILK